MWSQDGPGMFKCLGTLLVSARHIDSFSQNMVGPLTSQASRMEELALTCSLAFKKLVPLIILMEMGIT